MANVRVQQKYFEDIVIPAALKISRQASSNFKGIVKNKDVNTKEYFKAFSKTD